MKAKTVKKGSQFLETLKKDVRDTLEKYSDSDLFDLEKELIDLAEAKCKESFRNGVEVGIKTRQRKERKRKS